MRRVEAGDLPGVASVLVLTSLVFWLHRRLFAYARQHFTQKASAAEAARLRIHTLELFDLWGIKARSIRPDLDLCVRRDTDDIEKYRYQSVHL